MKLSIVIPIYNVEDYLERCLNSILQNEFKDYEVLMIDDGTKDSSGLIADEYASKYENFHAFHKENGGLSDARNYGLKKASGEYVWFIDSDDYITSGSIDVFVQNEDKVKSDVYCFTIEKHSENNDIEYIEYTPINGTMNGSEFLKFQYTKGTFRPEAWRNIYRRSLLVDHDLYFEKGILHEDDEWTPRVLVKASKVLVLKHSAYVYVVRGNSIMKQQSFNKHIESIKFMIDKYVENDFGFDSELRLLILDRMINNYISTFAKGDFFNDKRYYLPYKFFKDKIAFSRTRVKVLIFCFNKKLFCKISHRVTPRES